MFALAAGVLPFLLACASSVPEAPPGAWANEAPAVVEEVLPCGDRTALHVREAVWEFWAVVPDASVAVGDYVLLGKGTPTTAACGGRTLDAVAIDLVRRSSLEETALVIRISPPEGGSTIASVYADKAALEGQDVAVAGRIWKASKGIYGTNWYHFRDGTGAPDANDMTATTHADFAIGDEVEARGKLTIDKDLGFGYFYAVILEDAVVTKR